MRSGIRAWAHGATLGSLVALAGCGSNTETDGMTTIARSAAGLVGSIGAGSGILGARNLEVSDAQLRNYPKSLIKVTRVNQGIAVGVVLADVKGPATIWRSTDEKTVTLYDGSLIATKGFGNDLSSARVPAVRAGTQDVLREHFYLGGDELMRRKQYFCDFRDGGRQRINLLGVPFDTTLVVETCRGEDDTFENSYWFAKGGSIVKTLQWASPEIGSLLIEVVPRAGAGGNAPVATPATVSAPDADGVVVISGSLD